MADFFEVITAEHSNAALKCMRAKRCTWDTAVRATDSARFIRESGHEIYQHELSAGAPPTARLGIAGAMKYLRSHPGLSAAEANRVLASA